MYQNDGIKILGMVCTFYTICVSGKAVNQKLPVSLENEFSLHFLSAGKHSEDWLWNIHKKNILHHKANTTWKVDNKDIIPLYSDHKLNEGEEKSQKLFTNCEENSFVTKDGHCQTCRQCRPEEFVMLPCTSFTDTMCRPLDRMQQATRCVDLFKRKYNNYLLKKYWRMSETQLRPHWLHVCFKYLADYSVQRKARRVKSVHKRQAGSNRLGNNKPEINSQQAGHNQFRITTAAPWKTTHKFRYEMENTTYTQQSLGSKDSGFSVTAQWALITLPVAIVILIAVTITLIMCRRRGKIIKRWKASGANQSQCKIDLMYESCYPGSDLDYTKTSQNLMGIESYELTPLNSPTRGNLSNNEVNLGRDECEVESLPHVKVISKSCTSPNNIHHSLLHSCLSPCEGEVNVERAMSTSSFLNSYRDDGNKLRGGNGDFHRRYVDVDYVHNDIDLHRQRHRSQNSSRSDLQDSYRRGSSNKRSDHSLDREQRKKANMYRTSRERGRNGSNTSSSARSYISIPPTSPSENYIEAGSECNSVRSTPPAKMAWLTKSLNVESKNESKSYQATLGTQTESDKDVTDPMCKTVFGTPWQFGGTFTSRGGLMQAKDSDVCLVVTANAVAKGEYIDIYGAVFTDTTEIRKKLDFPARESLITPVVEYHAASVNHFNKNVCIRLPHAMPEEFDESLIRVYTFSADERGKVLMDVVPLLGKANSERRTGVYWEKGSDGCSIHIYTTHFSGYFCTQCETSSLPSICTMVFGSHVQITSSRREIRVILYIWDRRLTIKDYLERFRKQESDVDRQLLTDMQVPLLDNASSDSRLVMKMEVMGEDEERLSWRHVSRPDGSRPLFKSLQVRKLSEIVHCCRQTDPIRVEWALENAPRQIPSVVFQCCIDIMHVHESTRDYETAMKEGSDDLMRTFYVRDLKVMTYPSEELKPDATVQLADLKRALLETSNIAQTEELCQEFGITVKDIGNFKKKYTSVETFQAELIEECLRRHGLDKFMNQLPTILERLHLNQILTTLETRKIIFRDFNFTDLPGRSDAPAQSKTISPVKPINESLGNDRDTTRHKSPYRRQSSSPTKRNRSTSPISRQRSREDSKGNHRPDLQKQMSGKSDDVFYPNNPTHQKQMSGKSDDVFYPNNPTHHQPVSDDDFKRSRGKDRESRQPLRQSTHRHNSPSADFSVDDEVTIDSHNVAHNRGRYASQKHEIRQPVKSQKSSSSRGDSVISSSSIPHTESCASSSHFPSRLPTDASMVTHADPKDFAEPYPDEFLDDHLQQTYKKEFAVRNNLHDFNSRDYAPYENMNDRIHLSNYGPQALTPESGQTISSSFSDPVSPYRKLSNEQRAREKSLSQDKDQTMKKELYGVHTVV